MGSKSKKKSAGSTTPKRHGSAAAKSSAPVSKKQATRHTSTNEQTRLAQKPELGRFPIVGLGASAGGLESLHQFFTSMPASSGMAFVVVTHQHPGHVSLLADLLGRKTTMPVVEVSAPIPVQPDHVYVSQPGFDVAILNGVLQPMKATRAPAPPMPVDFFFRSLAQDQKEFAIGIVLSGMGSDGARGVQAIKAELGMVIAQDESSAYTGMPNSAVATDQVDFVLPIAKMPEHLIAYASTIAPRGRRPRAEPDAGSDALHQIFVLIRGRTGHDFSQYKVNTMRRRIERRMNVHHLDSEKKYALYLQANPGEIDLLFRELLIGVTSFFRDPEAWDALGAQIADVLEKRPDGYVFRAWIPGCSSGEEAYSLAILLHEIANSLDRRVGFQIFGTDLDGAAIDEARSGRYSLAIAQEVSEQRLARYFTKEDDSYRVKQEIRETIVFAPQDLIADPPFTKLDLLSCRNLLIYFEPHLQKKLLPIFHYALKPDGLLVLGSSESISNHPELFVGVHRKWKIFKRQSVPLGTYVAEFPVLRQDTKMRAASEAARLSFESSLGSIADKYLLGELVPPTVIVHERGDVVHIHGRTGLFLEPAPGQQSAANIFNMAREGLQMGLSSALRQAMTDDREITRHGIQIKGKGDPIAVDLCVQRLREPEALRGLFRISFTESNAQKSDVPTVSTRIDELERELRYAKESHQSTIEQLETANEELKSTNEEMQSTNEELQSANEELETSKEEMQSLNEELQTLNAELQDKVEELSRANNDMKNLLNGTDIATIFLDNDLNIKRYTEQAKRVIRLIPSDVGRSIADLVSTLRYDQLVDDARTVLRTLVFKEIEVRGNDDARYLMRILPYRTVENVIDGIVLTFVDITFVRALQQGQERVHDALKNSPTRVFGQDRDLRYVWASSELFGREPFELKGKTDLELFGVGPSKEIVLLKNSVRKTLSPAQGRLKLPSGDAGAVDRVFQLYVEPALDAKGEFAGVYGVITDVTDEDLAKRSDSNRNSA